MRASRLRLEQQVAAFWCKVLRTKTCWIWEGAKFQDGYGNAVFDGVNMGAHRISWFLHNGSWPSEEIGHLCYKKMCVRIDHLRDVSHKVNMNSRICSFICRRGHKLKDPNLYYYTTKGRRVRRCKACIKLYSDRVKSQKNEAKKSS